MVVWGNKNRHNLEQNSFDKTWLGFILYLYFTILFFYELEKGGS